MGRSPRHHHGWLERDRVRNRNRLGRQGAAVSLIARGTAIRREAEEELNKKGISVATASVDVADATALGRAIEGTRRPPGSVRHPHHLSRDL